MECITIRAMERAAEKHVRETICDRFILLQEASGLNKVKFGRAVGLTSSQLTNIASYRTPPPHAAIKRASDLLNMPIDWIYGGKMPGFENPDLLSRITSAEAERRRRKQQPAAA
jgi:transcriptional regulator with XRE-family HTH domain